MRLAGHLGMTVGELLARSTARELTEWQFFEQQHGPLGGARGDWHAALIASTVVNALKGKKGRTAKVRDWLLSWGRRRATGDDMEAMAQRLAAAHGGKWVEGVETSNVND